ncbi:hypothetical protein [Undibacterium sp. TS12]|uniref:ExbD/TolR family protein n=1 Tax=Undibacterium sp. TS12 TaxID=2908202 RepID=UPI001F4CFA4B|nr:hypothetical protein [Undibacterium sp. TS12]MCH8622521.1 hypothetical protein [Undibacterium sp. TS12]
MTTCPHHPSTTFTSRADDEPALVLNLDNTAMIGVLLALIMLFVICLPPRHDIIEYGMPICGGFGIGQIPDVVNLKMDFDGRLHWNGHAITYSELDSYFSAMVRQGKPKPDLHLNVSPFTTYQQVIAVLASAQRHDVSVVGMNNTDHFLNQH